MSAEATLVASLTSRPGADDLRRLAAGCAWLEVRADLMGDLDAAVLRAEFPGRLLYTLRSRAEGGQGPDAPAARRERLGGAARTYDLVDLEGERDLGAELLAAVGEEQRVLSWHGRGDSLSQLRTRFETMAQVPARLYKLVTWVSQSGEELRPLALLRALERRDVVAFAAGAMGTWTRLVAPRLGAPVVYGAAGDTPAAPGQIGIDRLRLDYGLPDLPAVEAVFGVVGNPALASLSPRLHNGAYRALGIPALYLAFEPPTFGDFWLEVVERGSLGALGMPLKGLSVTTPFKEVALVVAGASSPLALRLSAANTLVETERVWEAETSDPEGVVAALGHHQVAIAGRRAAVVGVGGAGRAAAAGLALAGARVTLINRGVERGLRAATELGLPFQPLAGFDPAGFDLLVNATLLGRRPEDELPFEPAASPAGAVVLDLVYGERPTRLVERARELGRLAVDGREVLLFQARPQFRLMTGRELPVELGRRLLGLEEGG